VRKESGTFIEELGPRAAQLVDPRRLGCVQRVRGEKKIRERGQPLAFRADPRAWQARPPSARRARCVREKQRAHPVGRVVMNPVPRLWHVLDSCLTDPVRRWCCELVVEVRLTVPPYDERRKINFLQHEPLARDVAKTCAIPVQPSVKGAWWAYPLEKVTNDVVRKTVGHQ